MERDPVWAKRRDTERLEDVVSVGGVSLVDDDEPVVEDEPEPVVSGAGPRRPAVAGEGGAVPPLDASAAAKRERRRQRRRTRPHGRAR
jgi:hypothetical protein